MAQAAIQSTRKDILVHLFRLSSQEKTAIFQVAKALQTPQVATVFNDCLMEAVFDRMVRAEGCLELAKSLLAQRQQPPLEEERIRTVIGRAYYSIHHSIRAMCLHHLEFDPDGHEESIGEFETLLTDNAFRARSGLAPNVVAEIHQGKDNRSIADYSPYDVSRKPNTDVSIRTSNNWQDALQFNVGLAERIFGAANRITGLG